jgi:serine phosphatase RsbU (regulator of sigma subunit)/pSer/pThr/pTyr-binding forkhead associated (FHA) protein
MVQTPKLRVIKSFGPERLVPLDRSPFTIGRSGENILQTNDSSVSRYHAEVLRDGNEFRLLDKGSKCGTFVNGERVQTCVLKHNDRVRFGNETELIFLAYDDVAEDRPIVTDQPSIIMSFAGSDLRNVSKLLETARIFSGSMAIGEVLDLVLDMAIEVTGAERAFLVMKDPQGEPRYERGRNRLKQAVPEEDFQVSRTTLKQAMESGERVLLSDVQGPKNFAISDSILNLELRTIVCLPLKRFNILDSGIQSVKDMDQVLGAMYLDGKKATISFTKISEGILDSLAADATAVIENVRLLKESREKDRLEMELATAHEIQSILFPKIRGSYGFFEACAHNMPSRHISGDYYDLIRLADGSYGFTIADVSGKGVSAALLCSMTQGMLMAESQRVSRLAECFERVNKSLVQKTGSSKFITLFHGVLSPNGELRYINAGHNPPYLVHPGGRIEELTSTSVVLGAFDFVKYEEQVLFMQPGDLLCLFTDGVTEARNKDGDLFGEDKLQDLLKTNGRQTTDRVVDVIFDSVARHASGTEQSDDISVFVIRYTVTDGTVRHAIDTK